VPSAFQVWLGGQPADDAFYDRLLSVEVEEHADMPAAVQLRLPLSRTASGELSNVNDPGLRPLQQVAVTATPEGGRAAVLFDGYVLGHKLHLESGVRDSHLEVYGQDASWLMNLEEKTREWVNVTDGTVANRLFGEYGITPAAGNLDDDSGMYREAAHTLMQRGTDFAFLRTLARRGGRLLRVSGGALPGLPTGVFAPPDVRATPALTLTPNDPEAPNVRRLDFEWDVMRPTAVRARQTSFADASGTPLSGDVRESGLASLDARDLATFAGRPLTVMLTTPVDEAGDLQRRAAAVLRDAGWFVRCSGDVDLSAVRAVVRAGAVVAVSGVGGVHSGNYLVWSVRHTISPDAHRMHLVLARNAVGPAAPADAAAAGGLL
jgi:phage protein D